MPSPIQCFFVEPTGQERSEPRKCLCSNVNCDASYEITLKEYRRTDTGTTLFGYPSDFGPGAMYYSEVPIKQDDTFYYWDNDSQHLIVVCPEHHEWDIDSRASNCDQPNDRLHRCWIRHGSPPAITVDKNGLSCGAGAGSIRINSSGYHGRLINGVLQPEGDSSC
jgi:hypothetical protein